MLNRRSFIAALGLAPITAPTIAEAIVRSEPPLQLYPRFNASFDCPAIAYTGQLRWHILEGGLVRLVFNGSEWIVDHVFFNSNPANLSAGLSTGSPASGRQTVMRGAAQSAAKQGIALDCATSEIRGGAGAREAAKRLVFLPAPVRSPTSPSRAARHQLNFTAGHPSRRQAEKDPARSNAESNCRQAVPSDTATVPFSLVPGASADHVRREMNSRIGATQGVGNPTQVRGNLSRACG